MVISFTKINMIVYDNTKFGFNEEVRKNLIVDSIIKKMNNLGIKGVSDSERRSWENSLSKVKNLLESSEIADDCHIAIEYKIPTTSNRIDFMISGHDKDNNKNVVIIELKQWENAQDSGLNNIVKTFIGRDIRELKHPSYQAKEYEYLLKNFNESIFKNNIGIFSCAYLHNAAKDKNINLINSLIYSYITDCPLYFKEDYDELQQTIIKFVGKGKGKEILFEIENGKLVPSKKLIDTIKNVLEDNENYILVDTQLFVYEKIMNLVNQENNVFIINGNPGTGKSVVAVNLLKAILENKKSVQYITPNKAFRSTIENSLKGKGNSNFIKATIKGSSSYWDVKKNTFDWLIVDEAHRLKEKAYMYKGSNQIKDIINSSKNTVFFVDDNQLVTAGDIGTTENIEAIARLYNKKVFYGDEYILKTQFRCLGMDGYINAIDTTLQIEETGNFYLDEEKDYEFKIFDTPQELENAILEKSRKGFKSKIVAGYAWKWESKNLKKEDLYIVKDIKIPEYNYELAWNYNDQKMLWALDDEGPLQAGCVHTCQGIEFDYCGVIIGNDLKIDEFNNIYADYDEYKDANGKKGLKNNNKKLSKLVKNIYKILMTRGQKGTYLFIRDKKVKEYFLKHLV